MARNKSEKERALDAEDFRIPLRHMLVASRAPTDRDDECSDYSAGSIWVNTETASAYICTDHSTCNAQWVLLSKPDVPIVCPDCQEALEAPRTKKDWKPMKDLTRCCNAHCGGNWFGRRTG